MSPIFDDILITGPTEERHLIAAHREVLSRPGKEGLMLKKKKCAFSAAMVGYLSFIVKKL